MAAQNFLLRGCSLWNCSSKLIFSNRLNHITQHQPFQGLKSNTQELKLNIPEKPKRPLTAYFKFLEEKRPILVQENPTMPNKEIIKTLAEQWHVLDPTQKAKYEKVASQLREQYDQEILKYNAQLTPEQEQKLKEIRSDIKEDRKKRKLKKEMREMGKPSKPLNSFGLFAQPQLVGQKRVVDVLSVLRKKWAEMSEVEKEKYQVQYLRNREAYEKELEKWEKKMIAMDKSHLVRVKTLKVTDRKNPQ